MLYIPQTRRRLIASAARAAALVPFYRSLARANGDAIGAATANLLSSLSEAALARRPFVLPAGVTTIYQLFLPDGTHLVGRGAGSTLRLGYAGPMISNHGALQSLSFENVTFDGADLPINSAFGLLTFSDVARMEMENCVIQHSTIGLMQKRCGGRIRLSTFRDLTCTAILDENCAGVTIDANRIERCGDNGVHHWSAHSKRYDGSRISNNTIADISNRSGGEGLYGNGVRVAECGPVTIENNHIERCAYTAVRNTGGWDVVIADNRCKSFNEKAMYAEFGFRNATFRNNVIEDCGAGISATNYVGPGNGAGALISGNVVSKIRPSHPDPDFGPRMNWLTGVEGEGDVRMVGNIVVGSPWFGILAGFFDARNNVVVEANRLIDNEYGIGFAAQGDRLGPCEIVENDLRGSKKANIVAMFQTQVISGDLALPGAVNTFKNVVIRGNRIV
ncbi:TIGR03808 family TAT-translocated repetitive protein [Rhodoblastus acidophilus]|uniref:TIGR03808 family TAT-translocated repetitive protein n=1 Tax=Candidatus Rhodoblastus alkanivorans TaxID=2954117 RepID=A0ABS9Z1S6_9HYPH|nr:TIGR03808 family TAT-translocated repetitive protein [Candidatus Rhodoblastus alkanivorans]MCI4678050.1 TIGR03808 family TAT-translocated repetitive protein [Candidatus Rhodoblastus alkanivorans]MCI4681609.1 TIGR03808 family TAT-translocated repetitive protein [Candidatus Rhodoblastus alkanivorans]MDI4642657.1 TIGR03808 family TAT-translocated repetitive protein [Rhodoblastus acidophilus]